MKNIYAISLACALTLMHTEPADAQGLYRCPQPGFVQTEVYHWDYTTQFLIENKSIFLVDDTIVGVDTFYRYTINSPLAPGSFLTTYDSGKVYLNPPYNNPTGGILLYDFSLQVGDSFSFPSLSFNHSGTYVVDSVGSVVMLNSQVRKYMRLTNGTRQFEWIDAIGDIEYGFIYSSSWEGSHEEFICNHDSTGDVFLAPNTTFDCNPYGPVGSNGPNTCSQFSYQAQVNGPACVNCTGSITITNVGGGTPPYSYSWSNGDSTTSASGLCEGPINLTVTDSTGLSCTRTFYVSDNPMVATAGYTLDDTCNYVYTLCATISGGTPPYTYNWVPAVLVGNCITMNLIWPVTFTVYVTDVNGCTATDTTFINPQPVLTASAQSTSTSCGTCCDGNVVLNISGGVAPYTISGNPNWPSNNNFCEGSYYYCVTDSNGCIYCDSVYVQSPNGLNEQSLYKFEIYPNPTTHNVVITSNAIGETLKLIDFTGKQIESVILVSNTQILETRALSEGIYFLQIGSHTERLIVCH
jgi:hypothetical protein